MDIQKVMSEGFHLIFGPFPHALKFRMSNSLSESCTGNNLHNLDTILCVNIFHPTHRQVPGKANTTTTLAPQALTTKDQKIDGMETGNIEAKQVGKGEKTCFQIASPDAMVRLRSS